MSRKQRLGLDTCYMRFDYAWLLPQDATWLYKLTDLRDDDARLKEIMSRVGQHLRFAQGVTFATEYRDLLLSDRPDVLWLRTHPTLRTAIIAWVGKKMGIPGSENRATVISCLEHRLEHARADRDRLADQVMDHLQSYSPADV